MSYQVLARKYRPRSFDTLVGQEHVVRALTHALENKRLHHAYLFTGTRGVGKTTLSRILAKAFNCQGVDGTGDVTAQPCGVCPACVAIDAGRFVDYIEMDAASNRGVDEMAQLLEQAVYSPSNARYKIYMIDEVHMLTAHAFNAMLKTLEEPPEYVKFVLATTDPQKIPVTVLSRCLQFNLKQMPPGHIVAHLENILAQEGIASEGPALRLLAQAAQGSMRDALSLTDQAIAYAAGTVTTEAVQGMLGALDQSYLVRLLDALAVGDGAGLLAVADEMAARSLSYAVALQDLGSLLQRMALAQAVPEALPRDLPEYDDIVRLAQAFDPEDVQLYYQIAVHGRNELGLAPDEYAGFSMTLLRMLAFRPGAETEAAAAPAPARPAPVAAPAAPRASAAPAPQPPAPARGGPSRPGQAALEAARNAANRALGGGGAQKKTEADTSAPAGAPTNAPADVRANVPAAIAGSGRADPGAAAWASAAESVAVSRAVREPMFETASETAPESVPEPAPESAPAPASAASAPARPSAAQLHSLGLDWDGDWPELARRLPLRGVVQQLAQQSELQGCERTGATLEMRLKVALETLCSAGSVEKLAGALGEHFGRQVRVVTEIGAVTHTAYAKIQAEEALRLRQAEQTVHGDPFVQTMMREFGATVVPGSIKPI